MLFTRNGATSYSTPTLLGKMSSDSKLDFTAQGMKPEPLRLFLNTRQKSRSSTVAVWLVVMLVFQYELSTDVYEPLDSRICCIHSWHYRECFETL